MDRSSVRTSLVTTLPKIPPFCIMASGYVIRAVHVSFSEDLYHGIGFRSTAHEAVKFPFASRAGIVYGANMFVTSA